MRDAIGERKHAGDGIAGVTTDSEIGLSVLDTRVLTPAGVAFVCTK